MKVRRFFLLSLIYRIEKVLFSGQFFETEFSPDLHVFRSPESENHVFSNWSVCVSVCLSVCLSVNTITQKRKVVERSNLVCRMFIIGGCYPKLFIEIGQFKEGGADHNSKTKRRRTLKFGMHNVYHRGMLLKNFHMDQII